MNCAAFQHRLMALSEPANPPPGLRAHLESCPSCQAVQRRLTVLERHVPRLPVPPSRAKERFLQRLRSETTLLDRLRYRLRAVQRWQVIAVSMAASLLLFFLAWSLAPDNQPVARPRPRSTTPDALFAKLIQHNLALAVAEEPRQQVVSLANLAEDLRGQAKPLLYYGEGKEGKESLKDLSDWYGQAVRLGVARAGELPPEQRRPVLAPIIQQLTQACEDAEAAARNIHNISADHPLYTIAFAARNGKDQLDTLLRREAASQRPVRTLASQKGVPPVSNAELLTVALFLQRAGLMPLLATATVRTTRTEQSSTAGVAAEQAQRFQRNRKLIQALVDSCLRMAGQRDLVERALSCTVVAERLAETIDQAAAEQDFDRAQELAQGLKDLLQRGVAFNLTTASVTILPGTVREPEMLQIGDLVKRLTVQLENNLNRTVDQGKAEHLQKTLQIVADGRSAVVKALKGRGSY